MLSTEHGVAFWVLLALAGLFVLRRAFADINVSAGV